MFKTENLRETVHQLRQNQPRLMLSVEEYKSLRHRVLERDKWRCQDCGSAVTVNDTYRLISGKKGLIVPMRDTLIGADFLGEIGSVGQIRVVPKSTADQHRESARIHDPVKETSR
jgi:hypothetical protein